MKQANLFAAPAFLLGGILFVSGCQSSEPKSQGTDPNHGAVPASERTPDGDRLDGPIPSSHWPYTLNRGGGGGVGR